MLFVAVTSSCNTALECDEFALMEKLNIAKGAVKFILVCTFMFKSDKERVWVLTLFTDMIPVSFLRVSWGER